MKKLKITIEKFLSHTIAYVFIEWAIFAPLLTLSAFPLNMPEDYPEWVYNVAVYVGAISFLAISICTMIRFAIGYGIWKCELK